MSKYYLRVQNFTPFCSKIARFPDNLGILNFSIGYNSKFEIFEKKSGTQKVKKNPKRSFVRTIVREIPEKFENFWL